LDRKLRLKEMCVGVKHILSHSYCMPKSHGKSDALSLCAQIAGLRQSVAWSSQTVAVNM